MIQSYSNHGMLTTHDSVIPEDEIWIKIGGDHGRDSFKLCMQVANLKKPNSKNHTVMIGYAKVKDTHDNLRLIFEEFSEPISILCNEQWNGKTMRVFMFGDYKFLADIYGLSGAASKHPCIWCLKTRGEMQSFCPTKSKERTVQQLIGDNNRFQEENKGKNHVSEYNNALRRPLIDIDINQVAPPILHILLAITKNIMSFWKIIVMRSIKTLSIKLLMIRVLSMIQHQPLKNMLKLGQIKEKS